MEVDFSYGVICFLSLGSNVADPPGRVLEALDRLSEINGIKLLRRSSLYRTEPVGDVGQPWFINAVAEIRTVMTAHELLKVLQAIEKSMGRTRAEKWGPRPIDLDILLYAQDVLQEEDLIIPHPELHKRRFVLVPLCEISPYAIHPAFGVSMRGLLDRVTDKSNVELSRSVHL